MSLPASQQRVLDTIENGLSRREPRLASMFAIFTRLTHNEALPRLEALNTAPWWSPHRWSCPSGSSPRRYGPLGPARTAVFLTLAAVLVVAAVFVGMNGARGCAGPIVVRGPLTGSTHTQKCPMVPQAKGFGHGP